MSILKADLCSLVVTCEVRALNPFGDAPSSTATSGLPHARAQGDEKLVQLLERLDHSVRKAGAGSVESFLRGVEIAHDQQRLATFFLEGDRGDGPTLTTFFIRPDEA